MQVNRSCILWWFWEGIDFAVYVSMPWARFYIHYSLPSCHVSMLLTPKGPNVSTVDKPVLVNVTWAHTIFRFLDFFCEDASCSKLCGEKSRIFWTYGSKVMDVWSFEEKNGQGGHVLKPTSKSWLHQPKKVGSRNKESWERPFESFLSNLLNLAPTLGRLKSSLPHGAWRF
jgi:hypothetical protein